MKMPGKGVAISSCVRTSDHPRLPRKGLATDLGSTDRSFGCGGRSRLESTKPVASRPGNLPSGSMKRQRPTTRSMIRRPSPDGPAGTRGPDFANRGIQSGRSRFDPAFTGNDDSRFPHPNGTMPCCITPDRAPPRRFSVLSSSSLPLPWEPRIRRSRSMPSILAPGRITTSIRSPMIPPMRRPDTGTARAENHFAAAG